MATESAIDTALAAVVSELSVSSFLTLTPGGVSENPPAAGPYPAAWVTAKESDARTFGVNTRTVDVQVHIYCDKTVQEDGWPVLKQAVGLLDGITPALTNWDSLLFLYDRAYRLPDETIDGTPVSHIAGSFILTAEQTS
jgi:hypothetical protein